MKRDGKWWRGCAGTLGLACLPGGSLLAVLAGCATSVSPGQEAVVPARESDEFQAAAAGAGRRSLLVPLSPLGDWSPLTRVAPVSPPEVGSRAALLALRAGDEAAAHGQWEKSRALYVECLRSGVPKFEGPGDSLARRCEERLVEASLSAFPRVLDDSLVALLLELRSFDRARNYTERVALNIHSEKPEAAQKLYEQLLKYSPVPNSFRIRARVRLLDLAIESANPAQVEKRWLGLVSVMREAQAVPVGIEARQEASHALVRRLCDTAPDRANLSSLLRLHSLLRHEFESYASNDGWDLSLLEVLERASEDGELVAHAESFRLRARTPEAKRRALAYVVEGRRRALGLPEVPDWDPGRRLEGGRDDVAAFVRATAEVISSPENEASQGRWRLLAAYAAALADELPVALDLIAVTFREETAGLGEAASFFLKMASRSGDAALEERLLRLVVAAGVVPAAPEHRNPRAHLEELAWARAERLFAAGDLKEALAAYGAFREEFPASERASVALWKSARAALDLKDNLRALTLLEDFLEKKPSSGLRLDAHWQAAEVARLLGRGERVAEHLAAFAELHPSESVALQAWLKAASQWERLGNAGKAREAYERYLLLAKAPRERIEGQKALAHLMRAQGNRQAALALCAEVRRQGEGLGGEEGLEVSLWAEVMTMDIHVEAGNREEAELHARRAAAVRGGGQTALFLAARARFVMGSFLAEKLVRRLEDPHHVIEHELIMESYDEARSALVAVCEVPGHSWCAAAYFETSALAAKIGEAFRSAVPPPSVEGGDSLRDAVLAEAARLASERAVYAQKARNALEISGAPNGSYRERILRLRVAGAF